MSYAQDSTSTIHTSCHSEYVGIVTILNMLNDALAIWAESDPKAYQAVRSCLFLKVIDDKLESLTDDKTGKLWIT